MKYLLLILATLYLTGCHTRQINGIDNLIETQESIASNSGESLPKTWRGKKLFDSPYAYFYANNIDDVEEAYDIIRKTNESFHDDTDIELQKGVVIITGLEDFNKERPFNLTEIITLYRSALDSEVLTEQEKIIYEQDYKSLIKLKTAEEKEFKEGKFNHSSLAFILPHFIQPLILAKLLSNDPQCKNFLSHNNIWWACFMTLEDVSDLYIDTEVDNMYEQIGKDNGAITKGITWALTVPIISPIKTYGKFKIGSLLEEIFVRKLKQNAAPYEGIVRVNQEVILEDD